MNGKASKMLNSKLISVCLMLAFILACGFPNKNKRPNSMENKKKYSINVGETFQINLDTNPSTGCNVCWLNESTVKSIELIEDRYIPQDSKAIGGGGIETLTFKGTKAGTDSILYANCPTGIRGRSCESFSDGSVKPQYVFFVVVKN